MKDIILGEVRDCNRAIRKIKDSKDKKTGNLILAEAVKTICDLAAIARREGLLSLEIALNERKDIFNGKYLNSILINVVDGADPRVIEEISIARYFSADLAGYEGLHYLVLLYGSLAIQAGENSKVIEDKLLAFIPSEAEEEYRKGFNNKEDEEPVFSESKEDALSKYYKGDIAVTSGDEYYYQIKIIDYLFRTLDDRSIQRFLRDVDNYDLTLALKGVSGNARHRIFDNLSLRLAKMIAEDMEAVGAVPLKEVGSSAEKLLRILIILIENREIKSADEEAIVLFSKIFDAKSPEEKGSTAKETENELYILMKEYEGSLHKLINASCDDK